MCDLRYASTRYFAGELVGPIEPPELARSLFEREWFYNEYEKRTGRPVGRERVRYWQIFSAFTGMTRDVLGSCAITPKRLTTSGTHGFDTSSRDTSGIASPISETIGPNTDPDTDPLDWVSTERIDIAYTATAPGTPSRGISS